MKIFVGYWNILAFSMSEMGSQCKALTKEITWNCLSSKKIISAIMLRIDCREKSCKDRSKETHQVSIAVIHVRDPCELDQEDSSEDSESGEIFFPLNLINFLNIIYFLLIHFISISSHSSAFYSRNFSRTAYICQTPMLVAMGIKLEDIFLNSSEDHSLVRENSQT